MDEYITVEWCGLGGATIDIFCRSLCPEHVPWSDVPDVVWLEIGGNDLDGSLYGRNPVDILAQQLTT